MDSDHSRIAEQRIKHLEMVQSVVARMAAQGAALKNYCLTITTAAAGFGITLQRPAIILLSLLPITIFALLDAQYLRLERQFRDLFDRVRKEDWSVRPTFEISTSGIKRSYFGALTSWSIFIFYAPLAVAVAMVGLIARCIYGKFL